MRFRFLLNVVVLALFGLSVFAITNALNLIASNDEIEEQEFSFVKRTADQHWGDKNYEAAGHYYKQLVESDSLNSSAHAAYAHAVKMQIEGLLRRLRRSEKESDQSSIDEIRSEVEPLVTEAIEAYKKTMEFPQFRNYARLHLTLLEGYSGNTKVAADYLQQMFKDGGTIRDSKPLFFLYECEDILEQFDPADAS